MTSISHGNYNFSRTILQELHEVIVFSVFFNHFEPKLYEPPILDRFLYFIRYSSASLVVECRVPESLLSHQVILSDKMTHYSAVQPVVAHFVMPHRQESTAAHSRTLHGAERRQHHPDRVLNLISINGGLP